MSDTKELTFKKPSAWIISGVMQFDSSGTVWINGSTLYKALEFGGMEMGYEKEVAGSILVRLKNPIEKDSQEYDAKIKEYIEQWADSNMLRKCCLGVYPTWEKIWLDEEKHTLTMLRLCGNDVGADIVILSCSASCGTKESDWNGCNLGNVKSLEQIADLYAWLNRKAQP